jgi:dephospho-CoA kinase
MLKIGLTGGIGSGKSSVAKYFAELGITIIDADKIARELVATGTSTLTKIVKHFGNKVLTNRGTLDRKYLRKLIFSNPKQKQWLEKLLHPLIYQEMEKRVQQVNSPYCVLVIPLLLETRQEKLVDRILVVDAPQQLQINRTMKKNKISETEVKAIIVTQANREQRLTSADDIIYNDNSLTELKQQVQQLHQRYLILSK